MTESVTSPELFNFKLFKIQKIVARKMLRLFSPDNRFSVCGALASAHNCSNNALEQPILSYRKSLSCCRLLTLGMAWLDVVTAQYLRGPGFSQSQVVVVLKMTTGTEFSVSGMSFNGLHTS
jgi:hypothetical protein